MGVERSSGGSSGRFQLCLTVIVTSICTSGLVAGLLVWQLTPRPVNLSPGSPVNIPQSPSPTSSSSCVADDGGGGLDPRCQGSDPLEEPGPSSSKLGRFKHAAVAVDSPYCARVAKNILAEEGTAVDSAVAALFCNGVVQSQSMGLGGGFVMTIYLNNGTRYALMARETAPAGATRDMYKGDPRASKYGPKASGIPGEVAGYWEAKQRFGNPSISWRKLIEPSIKLCKEGIPVFGAKARSMKKKSEAIKKDPGLRGVFLNPKTGEVWEEGDTYPHPALGRTLERIANSAQDFYTGETARLLLEDLAGTDAIITKDDLANYKVAWEDPVSAEVPGSGYTILSSPPPAGGAVTAAILAIAGRYNPTPPDRLRTKTWQRFVEACKFGFARRTLMGDWNYAPIRDSVQELVANLTSSSWLDSIVAQIDDFSTSQDAATYGAEFYSDVEDHGTSHMSILSPAGDAVSATSTVNTLFGSLFMSPQTGVILNNQMDDFASPNITNAFGIPPSASNLIVAGKRPVSSMSPSIVLDTQGRVVAIAGASGGTRIITATAQVLYRMLYLGEDAKQAVDARRVHHQLYPMVLNYEQGVTRWIVKGLQAIGHKVKQVPSARSTIQAILVDQKDGTITANADFRKGGDVDGI